MSDIKFRVNKDSKASLKPITEVSTVTLDDLIVVVPVDGGNVIDTLSVYFYTPGSGGFYGEPAKTTRADIPEEAYKGKDFFLLRGSDYFTEEQIHGSLVIDGKEKSSNLTEEPILRYDLGYGVHIDKEQGQNIGTRENITLEPNEGVNITSITFLRFMGNWDSLSSSIDKFRYVEYEDTWGLGNNPYTFNFREYYTPSSEDDLFFVLIVETDGEEPDEEPIVLPLDKDLSNVYIEPDLLEIDSEKSNVVTITADHLHYITSIDIVESYPDTKKTETVAIDSDSIETYELDLGDYLNADLVGIKLKVVAEKHSSRFVIEDIVNASVYPYEDSKVNDDTVIILTANEGLTFNDEITLIVRIPEELQENGMNPKTEEVYKIYPDNPDHSKYYNEDKSVIRIPLEDFWKDEYYQYTPKVITITHVVATEKKLNNGFVTNYATIYKMDRESLDTFTNSLISLDDYSFVNSIYNKVYSVFMIPFKLPSEMISSESKEITKYAENINEVSAKAHYTLDNRYILPLGEIETPTVYNNVFDYKDTTVYLHSPYVEQPINIDTTYVIGETLSLDMAIDLYNGDATLNIYSSKVDGELVQRTNIPIKHDIPIMSNGNNVIERSIGGYIYNKITTPFVEIVRNKPYENDSPFGKAMNEYGKVKDFTGYLEMVDTNVNTSATTVEQEMIKNELQSGVVIRPTK